MFFLMIVTSSVDITSSLSFRTRFNKNVALMKYEKNSNNIGILFHSIFKRKTIRNNEQKEWYYVHFLTSNISEILKSINIKNGKEIIKNTYSLFLSHKQIDMITNFSLVTKINPTMKYIEESVSYEDAEYFAISTTPHFQLPSSENYNVEKKNNVNSFIIHIKLKNNKIKKKIIKQLSKIPEVKSIIPFKKATVKNSIMTGFTQKNSLNFEQKNNFLILNRYLNDHGLTGEGQIVTILDTPLDFYHSMFRDDNVPVELNKYMPNHRKIIYYGHNGNMENLQNTMEDNEHGTHVSGTVAGNSICKNNIFDVKIFDGNAPEAKILFAGHFNDIEETKLKELMMNYNSSISTNSWGSVDYDSYGNMIFGKHAYANPRSIFIFSAGNEYNVLNGNFSVCDPAGSKNVLAVGAISDFYYDNFIMKSLLNPEIVIIFDDLLNSNDIFIFETIECKNPDSKVLFIDTSEIKECRLIEHKELILLYGIYDVEWLNECSIDNDQKFFYTDDIEKIKKLLEIGGPVLFERIFVKDENKKIDREIDSSTGPGNGGILKPDVMAPGSKIISAKSKVHSDSPHGCLENLPDDYFLATGTSMAAPNIAGGMALVHQYFNSGRWIQKVNLDGSTSRALIINSCRHPSDSKKPDITFGHGVVDLSTILPVENDFGIQITYQNQDKDSIMKHSVAENGHVTAKINVKKSLSKNKLQITLSYLDPMLDFESPIPISRDLDMIIVSPSMKKYIGDHLDTKDTQHVSTNEKIIINENEIEDGVYTIHIYGGNFVDKLDRNENEKQEFAVVASGPIENIFLEFEETNECPCEKCDANHPGFCLCDDNKSFGQICQINIDTIKENNVSFYVDTLEIKRVRFVSDLKIKSIVSKSSNPGRGATIWVSKTCHLSLGEYEINGETGNQSEIDKTIDFDLNSNEICVAIFNNNDRKAKYNIEIYNEQKESKKNNLVLIICVSIGSFIVLVIIIIIIVICVKRGMCKKKDRYDRYHDSESSEV